MIPADIILRVAEIEDLPALTDIYNQAILAGFQTADLTIFSIDDRKQWLMEHAYPAYPVFIAEYQGKVIGYCSVSPYRKGREALLSTVEISYYLHKDFQGKRVGTMLLAHALEHCRKQQYKVAIAVVLDVNTPSCKLLENHGFKVSGHLENIAEFNGVPCGHLYYCKALT